MLNDGLNIHGVKRTAVEALSCKISSGFLPPTTNELPSVFNRKKSPLLNRIYTMRSIIVHHIVNISLELAMKSSDGCQFLSLGGGLDTSYDQLASCPSFVVDLPEVITQRQNIYNQLNAQNHPILVTGDLNSLDQVMESLSSNGFRFDVPTVILVECVLSYLPMTSHHHVLSMLATSLHKDSILITYDPHVISEKEVVPHGFSQQMKDRFENRAAPLLGAHANTLDHMTSLRSSGWKHNICMTMNQAWKLLLPSEQRRTFLGESANLESFDEIGSLLLLNSLYGISISSSSSSSFGSLWDMLMLNGSQDVLEVRINIANGRYVSLAKHVAKSQTQSTSNRKSIFIRNSLPSDSDKLSDLYIECFESYSHNHKSVAKFVCHASKDLKKLEKHYAPHSKSRLFVALDSNVNREDIVGCIGLKVYSKCRKDSLEKIEVYEISHFCVDRNSRGKGIGSLLLKSAVEYARSLSAENVELTVLDDLIEARRLYENAGFILKNTVDIGNSCILHHLKLTLN